MVISQAFRLIKYVFFLKNLPFLGVSTDIEKRSFDMKWDKNKCLKSCNK